MTAPVRLGVWVLATAAALSGCRSEEAAREAAQRTSVLRVATYNIEDVRSEDLRRSDHPRLTAAAAILQGLRPDVLLINEIAYDQPGAPGFREGEPPGQNGQRFADTFLAVSQGSGLEPLRYRAFMAPTNTGEASGFDLDNDGLARTAHPEPPPAPRDGSPAPQTPGGRAYGGDAWGFGTFPGQFAMALLVREGLEILDEEERTFRLFPWSWMPGALAPVDPETGDPWYAEKEWLVFRLSSKSHWDVPVRLPEGTVIHFLCSHPTPPAFDGPEERNRRRNHDEIRLWTDYLSGGAYIVDDAGRSGGLAPDALFVLLGDQNADPDEGGSYRNPIGNLLEHPRIQGTFVPRADSAAEGGDPELDPDDTAEWGLRVDYVLPSTGLEVVGGGIWRPPAGNAGPEVSDHFPVWLDLEVPAAGH